MSHPRITRNLAVPVLLLVSLTASACGGKLLQAQELDGDASNNMARMTATARQVMTLLRTALEGRAAA